MKISIISTLAAIACGSVTSFAQTAFSPGYDSDIVDAGDDTYNVTGPVSIGVNAEMIIDRPVFVTDGGSLTISEGAILRFQPYTVTYGATYICVSTDGEIHATGTSINPVIFTTAADTGGNTWSSGETFLDSTPKTSPMAITTLSHLGLWGGLIILGEAPINTGAVDDPSGPVSALPGRAKIEGVGVLNDDRVYYGGFDPNDDSGTLKYVSIRYSGHIVSADDEIQGLTLGGVGYGTTLDYIEVYGSSDDGIQIFGGTAALSHIAVSFCDDDAIDVDQGYTGTMQFGLIYAGNAAFGSDSLLELNGDDDNNWENYNVSDDGRPFAYATIYNFTIVGGTDLNDAVIHCRDGFGGNICNSIIANVDGYGLRISDSGTYNAYLAGYPVVECVDRVEAGTLNFKSTSWYGIASDTAVTIAYGGSGSVEEDVLTNDSAAPLCADNVIGALTVPKFANNNSTFGSLDGTAPFNPVPFDAVVQQDLASYGSHMLESTSYRGAFQRVPSALMWTTGWTALNTSSFLVDNGVNANLVAP